MVSNKFFINRYFLNSLLLLGALSSILSDTYLGRINAHMKGKFLTEETALIESLKLGCKGAHKNKDKWLPCSNEKELHKYLRK